MEAERDLFPIIKIWGIQKGFCAQQPHRVLLGINSNANFFWRHSHRHTRNSILLIIWVSLSPEKLTITPWVFSVKNVMISQRSFLKYDIRSPQVAQCWKNLPASARDARGVGSIPGLGGSPGKGNGNLFQDSCLENIMVRGTWWATVHGIAKNWTWLSAHTHHLQFFLHLNDSNVPRSSYMWSSEWSWGQHTAVLSSLFLDTCFYWCPFSKKPSNCYFFLLLLVYFHFTSKKCFIYLFFCWALIIR